MKLLTKTTIYYLLITSIVFLIGGTITYYSINNLINEKINESFERREKEIYDKIARGDTTNFRSKRSRVEKLKTKLVISDEVSDTIFLHHKWYVHLRKKTIVREIGGAYYKISIFSYDDSDEKVGAILMTITHLFLALMFILLLFNYFVSRKLWRPFNHTLLQIRNFDLKDNQAISFQKTNTKEFNELNKLVAEMTEQIRLDYKNLKEFTENASHEIQTPLAIIKNKLELLLNSSNLDEEQLRLIDSAYSSTSKLSKLSKTLALITKIENQEFSNIKAVDFKELIENSLYNFKELIELKSIELNTDMKESVFIQIDPAIADILISNLLKNAIKHNTENGKISIELSKTHFIISNTGKALRLNSEKLFERFQKDNPSSNSLGLGLSIVKKICEVNQFKIHYQYQKALHQLEIVF